MALIKSITPSLQPDADLLEQYRKSRQQSILAELFLRYSDLVYGTCVKYLGDQENAKDEVMNIYQELVEKVHRHDVENFKSWLYTLTKNHCLMLLRKTKRMPTVSFDGQLVQSEDFSHLESMFEKERSLEQLNKCLDALGNEQRESVTLFYLENKSYNEIINITGHDWNKVRSLVQNGRRNLKICMENNG